MGRKPIGKTAMTGAERNQRWLDKKYGCTVSEEIKELKARSLKLEKENAGLRVKASAVPHTVEEWAAWYLRAQQREAALRKAKRAPDEKTKEEYERQIKSLRTQLTNARAQLNFARGKQRDKVTLDKAGHRLILACLHPDDSASAEKRHRAFVLFQSLGLEPKRG